MKLSKLKIVVLGVGICSGLAYMQGCGSGLGGGQGGTVPTLPSSNKTTDVNYANSSTSTGVYTYHNDLNRSGQYINETILTPNLLTSNHFGKLGAFKVDGQVYGQPLFAPDVPTASGKRQILIAVTEHDSVYAFDADSAVAINVWGPKSLLGSGESPLTSADVGTDDITPEIGITSTPVVDPATNTLYVVAKSKAANGKAIQRIHAIDLTNGNEKLMGSTQSPVEIQATGGGAIFDPLIEGQRAALTLDNGQLYILFASHGDNGDYHGWVLAYNASNLKQTAAFNNTPNGGKQGGIWMAGDGAAVDADHNLYFSSGNGTFNADTDSDPSTINYGDTITKLGLTQNSNGLAAFSVLSYFTPAGQAILQSQDLDLGSGGVMLLPDQINSHAANPAAFVHLAVGGGKDGLIYVMNRDSLGGYHSTNEVVSGLNLGGDFSTPAFWNGNIYLGTSNGPINEIQLNDNNGVMVKTSTAVTFGAGPGISISANGNSNGIVWALEKGTRSVLHAYNPTTLKEEWYNSETANSGSDKGGTPVKFSVPTVAHGKVFIGNDGQVVVYGSK